MDPLVDKEPFKLLRPIILQVGLHYFFYVTEYALCSALSTSCARYKLTGNPIGSGSTRGTRRPTRPMTTGLLAAAFAAPKSPAAAIAAPKSPATGPTTSPAPHQSNSHWELEAACCRGCKLSEEQGFLLFFCLGFRGYKGSTVQGPYRIGVGGSQSIVLSKLVASDTL